MSTRYVYGKRKMEIVRESMYIIVHNIHLKKKKINENDSFVLFIIKIVYII